MKTTFRELELIKILNFLKKKIYKIYASVLI